MMAFQLTIDLNDDGTINIYNGDNVALWCQQHGKGLQIVLRDMSIPQPPRNADGSFDFLDYGESTTGQPDQPSIVENAHVAI
jgi:hypothetical protein